MALSCKHQNTSKRMNTLARIDPTGTVMSGACLPHHDVAARQCSSHIFVELGLMPIGYLSEVVAYTRSQGIALPFRELKFRGIGKNRLYASVHNCSLQRGYRAVLNPIFPHPDTLVSELKRGLTDWPARPDTLNVSLPIGKPIPRRIWKFRTLRYLRNHIIRIHTLVLSYVRPPGR